MIRRCVLALTFVVALLSNGSSQPQPWHGLSFNQLSSSWDEGIPLGNGWVGALAWQREGRLRISLDRADLWDLRPIEEFAKPEFSFSWVIDHVRKRNYRPVQEITDVPYGRDAGPTKIPAAAIEFPIKDLGRVTSVHLSLDSALCTIDWESGARCMLFVHATLPIGWYRFQRLPRQLVPQIVPPRYASPEKDTSTLNPTVDGQDLRRLGYPAPVVVTGKRTVRYRQTGYGGFSYEVATRWAETKDDSLDGVWSVSANPPYESPSHPANDECTGALRRGFNHDLASHLRWWHSYWLQSAIRVPDSLLEREWYLDTYKFGAASRRGAPPITLQAVWTADNGKLPPWRGDYHNDLNTQLSYWPCYSGNRLEEGLAFLDWLWRCRPTAKRYTARFFGAEGLNFPGVATLSGEQMGGWAQYSFSPTVSAWLAHHFYLHWRYSMDRTFLQERAYPWLSETAAFIERISVLADHKKRQLPLSSSPEINDNSIDAWFTQTTNYDLALIRWLFAASAELADELGLAQEAAHWRIIFSEWPELARSSADGALLVAPGTPLRESHRHFSHLMAIHPLGIVDLSNGERDRQTIGASLHALKNLGTDWWCGYSFAWLGSMCARAHEGDEAARALRVFTECFLLKNSFHANGDQTRSGKSKFTYRPFTLEGNFAYAAGIQEMLLQSHGGRIVLFPAIPHTWKTASFSTMRAEGSFLVSAELQNGRVEFVNITAECGGTIRLLNPFDLDGWSAEGIDPGRIVLRGSLLEFNCDRGQQVTLSRRH